MSIGLKEVDRVEILTLQDNYIDLVSGDSNEVVQRAMPLKDMEVKNSILAEHGFSALVSVYSGQDCHQVLFDFGFSENGAALNAEALQLDLSGVQAMALSHGHMDHTGALVALSRLVGKKGIDLVVHPQVFRSPRYLKIAEDFKMILPPLTQVKVREAGVNLVETSDPYLMADDFLLFLGEIPRKTDFEKGIPIAFHVEDGVEKWDAIEDDTAIVANIKGKGLCILSGCAHAGIVNTVNHAREVTGEDRVFAVMGGFHLTGPQNRPLIEPTIKGLAAVSPTYVVPTHCTGRDAVMAIEKAMPEQFILNMAGTKLIFAA